jgi:hypothetical protein
VHEKGGKRHQMPAHHKLEAFIDEYLAAAGRSARTASPPLPLGGRQDGCANGQADEPDRRLPHGPPPHSRGRLQDQARLSRLPRFRATGITAYLEAGSTLDNAQAMAAHESPRTTNLYDRTSDAVALRRGLAHHDLSWAYHNATHPGYKVIT